MDNTESKPFRTDNEVRTIIAFAQDCERKLDYASAESAWRQALEMFVRDRELHDQEVVNTLKRISDVCCAQGKYQEATLLFCLYKRNLRKLQSPV